MVIVDCIEEKDSVWLGNEASQMSFSSIRLSSIGVRPGRPTGDLCWAIVASPSPIHHPYDGLDIVPSSRHMLLGIRCLRFITRPRDWRGSNQGQADCYRKITKITRDGDDDRLLIPSDVLNFLASCRFVQSIRFFSASTFR